MFTQQLAPTDTKLIAQLQMAGAVNQSECVVLAHPTGNANVRAAAAALYNAGLLAEFWTSVNWTNHAFLSSILPPTILRELKRRSFPQIAADRIMTSPVREVLRLLSQKIGLRQNARSQAWIGIDASYRALDRKVARRLRNGSAARMVYAYEYCALEQFRAARDAGMRRVYELPTAYWRASEALFREEAALRPEWASTLPSFHQDAARDARKDEELALAELVVVASTYTKSTLVHSPVPLPPVVVVPYGAPAVTGPRAETKKGERLRVIYVGAVSQRKGVSYLFDAVGALGDAVSLTVIGRLAQPNKAAERELSKHRWIPSLSHPQVLEEMRSHDVLVFPSLADGFGLVILEAMAQGVPVITTPNTAGPDLIENGVDGFIVPVRSSTAIAARLHELWESGSKLATMSAAAQMKAARRTWQGYGDSLIAVLEPLLAE